MVWRKNIKQKSRWEKEGRGDVRIERMRQTERKDKKVKVRERRGTAGQKEGVRGEGMKARKEGWERLWTGERGWRGKQEEEQIKKGVLTSPPPAAHPSCIHLDGQRRSGCQTRGRHTRWAHTHTRTTRSIPPLRPPPRFPLPLCSPLWLRLQWRFVAGSDHSAFIVWGTSSAPTHTQPLSVCPSSPLLPRSPPSS